MLSKPEAISCDSLTIHAARAGRVKARGRYVQLNMSSASRKRKADVTAGISRHQVTRRSASPKLPFGTFHQPASSASDILGEKIADIINQFLNGDHSCVSLPVSEDNNYENNFDAKK